jgi:hypothetical protein
LTRSREHRTKPGKLAEPGAARKRATPEPEAQPFSITLRDVEIPPLAQPERPLADEELVLSDPEVQPAPYLGEPEVDRAAQRAARRAEVRRERARDAASTAPSAPEVLVLGALEAAGSGLCGLLRDFGFNTQVMAGPPALPAPWPFVAVFVDATAAAAAGDAIDLCNEVRERSRLPGELKPVLVLVAAQLSATDRVRAGLAGCNEILTGALSRGSVAGALDARGIALPSDARRT